MYFFIVARAACGFHSFGGLSATVERQVCFPLTGGYSRSLPRGFYSRVVVSCDFLYGSARSLRLPLTGGLGATVNIRCGFHSRVVIRALCQFYLRVVVSCVFLWSRAFGNCHSQRSLRLPLTGSLGATVEHKCGFHSRAVIHAFCQGASIHG